MIDKLFPFVVVFLASCAYGPPVLKIANEEAESKLNFPEDHIEEMAQDAFLGVYPIPQIIVDSYQDNEITFCVRSYLMERDTKYQIRDFALAQRGASLELEISERVVSEHKTYPRGLLRFEVHCFYRYPYDQFSNEYGGSGNLELTFILEATASGEKLARSYSYDLWVEYVRRSGW